MKGKFINVPHTGQIYLDIKLFSDGIFTDIYVNQHEEIIVCVDGASETEVREKLIEMAKNVKIYIND